jgi:dTDP-4-amino-4,6-dideoxygalactose transaminase
MMQKKIPFLDLKEQIAEIKREVNYAIAEVIESTAFSAGPFVTEFETNFAKYCSVGHAVGVNNGTSAIQLCLLALGIGRDDEVIVPANTFIASAWGVCHVNAKPVFIDCDAETWNIDPSLIESKITARTKAIIGVHLYGQPFDFDAVKKIADKHKLFVVEDCAQAHGATYKGRKAGSMGDMAAFSFYPGKNLGAFGEAGAVVSNNQKYIDYVRLLINQGSTTKYYHEAIGSNMRMDGLQGAVLNVKLRYIEKWTERRRKIAQMYQTGITNTAIKVQKCPHDSASVFHLFVITTEDRDRLIDYLNAKSIFPGIHYPVPIHLQKAFAHFDYKTGDFPNSEHLAKHCLSLPMFPELKDEDVLYVIEQLNAY